jgi:ketosteroid isomerase-like protein
VFNGNTQAAAKMLHPESRLSESQLDMMSGAMAQSSQMNNVNINVKNAEVVSGGGDSNQATVDLTIKISASMGGQSMSQESSGTVELRKYEGSWKVWSMS